jgi:hypothetical protein
MPWGFSGWFVVSTIVLSLLTYYMIFYFHRIDVAVWLFILWLFLLVLEGWKQRHDFEQWQKKVFGQ